MSSQLQIEANRRNAQHSTGPRTPEGKAVSRFNALKTGIEAKSQIIPGEDAGELETLSRDYYLEWQPATPTECALVDELVRADWQLRRLSRAEAQLWTHELVDAANSFNGLSKEAPLGQVAARSYHQFHFLQRRIDSADRALYRALDHLRRLRETSRGSEVAKAGPDQPPQPVENPSASSQIGFVPSNPFPAPECGAGDLGPFRILSPRSPDSPAPEILRLGYSGRPCAPVAWMHGATR